MIFCPKSNLYDEPACKLFGIFEVWEVEKQLPKNNVQRCVVWQAVKHRSNLITVTKDGQYLITLKSKDHN